MAVGFGALRGGSPQRYGILSAAALSLCLAGLTACGHGSHNPVIARVAGTPIHETTVAAWARAIEAGIATGAAWAPAHASARERALDYLISAHWLIAEAAQRGLGVSSRAVWRGISERLEVVPRGREEFQGGAGKQTIPGLKLEVQAELAASRLRTMVLSRVAPVTHATVLAYYKRHHAIFHIHQKRQVDLVENLPSRSAAITLGRRLGTGARFASRAEHELVRTTAPYEAGPPQFNTGLLRAIFAARSFAEPLELSPLTLPQPVRPAASSSAATATLETPPSRSAMEPPADLALSTSLDMRAV